MYMQQDRDKLHILYDLEKVTSKKSSLIICMCIHLCVCVCVRPATSLPITLHQIFPLRLYLSLHTITEQYFEMPEKCHLLPSSYIYIG